MQELRADPNTNIDNNADGMSTAVMDAHQELVIKELSETLGITADMLLPSLELPRALKEVAIRAENTYKDAVANYQRQYNAQQDSAAAAAAAAVAARAANVARATVTATPTAATTTAAATTVAPAAAAGGGGGGGAARGEA